MASVAIARRARTERSVTWVSFPVWRGPRAGRRVAASPAGPDAPGPCGRVDPLIMRILGSGGPLPLEGPPPGMDLLLHLPPSFPAPVGDPVKLA
jgi:hypothetical protein